MKKRTRRVVSSSSNATSWIAWSGIEKSVGEHGDKLPADEKAMSNPSLSLRRARSIRMISTRSSRLLSPLPQPHTSWLR